MKIAGFIKTSLIDYPGYIAAVIFTQGCNFRCGFCHNPELLPLEVQSNLIGEESILEYLVKRKNMIEAVVITGGEPTLQPDLFDFIKKVKELGYRVKLDTNGTNPRILGKILEQNLVDFVAMDIKGKMSDYDKICGPVNTKTVVESIDMIKQSNIDYEFRTTVLPYYHNIVDFVEIGEMLSGSKKYTIQGFRPQITFEIDLGSQKPFSLSELEEIKKIMQKYVKDVQVHPNL